MSNTSNIFISSLSVLIIFNFVISISGATEITFFNISNLIGVVITMIPIVLLFGINAEFHVFGTGGSTEGFNTQIIKILFTAGTLLTILFQFNLPEPIPFDLGLGLGSNCLSLFTVNDMGGIPYLIMSGIIILSFISGLILSIEG